MPNVILNRNEWKIKFYKATQAFRKKLMVKVVDVVFCIKHIDENCIPNYTNV